METYKTQARFVEWLSPEEMHKGSLDWLSELELIKDEHTFFENLITEKTLQLIEPEKFSQNKEVIDAIYRSQRRNNLLIEAVKVHGNDLQIMVDGIDQLKEEEAYKEEHRGLIIEVSKYLKEYKMLKKQLFDIVKNIMKNEKLTRLLDDKM